MHLRDTAAARVAKTQTPVDDSAATVVRCAADPRLLSVALYFASYGYSSAAQRASTGAVPRLRTLTNGHGLLEMMGTGASDDSATG